MNRLDLSHLYLRMCHPDAFPYDDQIVKYRKDPKTFAAALEKIYQKKGQIEDEDAKQYFHSDEYLNLLFGEDNGPVPDRFYRVLSLILKQDADIITLQELDHFGWLAPILDVFGYNGSVERKTSSPATKHNRHKRCDGCAIFWRREKLELVVKGPSHVKGRLLFSDFDPEYKKGKGDAKFKVFEPEEHEQTLRKGVRETDFNYKKGDQKNKKIYVKQKEGQAKQVAMYVTLKTKFLRNDGTDKNKTLTVLTGHFKSGDTQEDEAVKVEQWKDMIKNIEKHSKNGPLILAGDFNTDVYSPAYREFANGCKDIADNSAYPKTAKYVEDSGDEPYTAQKWRLGGKQKDKCKKVFQTIDFIFGNKEIDFYGKKRHLSVPKRSEVEAGSGGIYLPCWKYPSDHFMIGSDFTIKA